MDLGHQYFMTVVEEKSISKVAKKLFVSQQAVSERIIKLEHSYNAKLFVRKPKFRLTLAGETLYKTLSEINILEKTTKDKIDEITSNSHGKLRIGIPSSRARIILPSILTKFKRIYPNVELTFYNFDTEQLEQMIVNADLDFFLGVRVKNSKEFKFIDLVEEPIYLVMSEKTCKTIKFSGYKHQKSISPNYLKNLDLILGLSYSGVQIIVNDFLVNKKITPKSIMIHPDYDTQILLAKNNIGACFSPKLIIRDIDVINKHSNQNRLYAFSVKGLTETNNISIIIHKNAYITDYSQKFIEIMKKEFLLWYNRDWKI